MATHHNYEQRPRLTPHQREVYDRLSRRAAFPTAIHNDSYVHESSIGSKGALWHLVDKNYAVAREIIGPRGGTRYAFRPVRLTPDTHGNYLAEEGCDRCFCGVKYWEDDLCVDCGAHIADVLRDRGKD